MSGITTRTAYGKLQKPNAQDKDLRNEMYVTGQPTGSNRRALDVIPAGIYEVTASAIVEAGSNDFLVKITGHSAKVGDVCRILTSANSINEFEVHIDKIVDANFFELGSVLSASLSAGDTVSILRPVTQRMDSTGVALASMANSPVQFILDGSSVSVEEDTVDPNNNAPLPVKLMGLNGEITLNADQLNINLDDTDDSVALGDGNGNLIGTVTLPSSAIALSVQDDEALATLSNIDGKILPSGLIDSGNTTQTLLGANGVYTGDAFNVTEYAAINVNVVSDVPSATNGVKVEFSADGVNWVHSHSTTYSGGSGVGYIFNCEWQFARVVYTNGPVAQASFTLQTIFKLNPVKQSLYTISQSVSGNMFAELGKNVIIGETTGGGGGYVAVKVNPSGALTVEASLAAGTNNIGDVDVLSLPSLPAGTNNIGDVDVLSLPALPAGTNNIGDVDVATLPVSFNAGATDATTQRVVVANDQTLPISASSLPLPTGAATDAKLDSIITAIGSTNTKLDSIELNTSPELNSHQTQTVTSASAVTFTAPSGAKRMVIQNSLNANGAIRFTASAGTLTASSGFYLGIGQSTSEIPAGSFKAIATTASEDGDVSVIWFV
jgi:hypothetical protein